MHFVYKVCPFDSAFTAVLHGIAVCVVAVALAPVAVVDVPQDIAQETSLAGGDRLSLRCSLRRPAIASVSAVHAPAAVMA